jgi:antigen flippase
MSEISPVEVILPSASPNTARRASYGQILKSSSIVGGAQGLNLLIGMARTKLVAMLLGPTGVGLVGLYQSAVGLVGTLAGLGIGQSAVRQVAEAAGTNQQELMGRTVCVLRRMCWITGLLGALLTAILAWPLSIWTFGHDNHAWPIAILGITLFLGSLSAGQTALIQGIRRIGDLARLQVWSVVLGTIVSVGLYAWMGERGIVPVFIISAAINLGCSWWFARPMAVPSTWVTWGETFVEARGLITLGLAFMWSALLTAGVSLATRAMILHGFGIEANGIYQAAWGISVVFAGFILGAMGTDFYPRLTAAARDNQEINHLVNEQTEVGILLALPGLIGTLVFSPWIIRVFYTAKFSQAADLLPWFVVGIFGRVVSWPMGYILLAKGAARWFAVMETVFSVLNLGLVWVGIHHLGLEGVAVAFAILYGLYIFAILWAATQISEFRWSKPVVRLLLMAGALVAVTFILIKSTPYLPATILGGVLSLGSGFFCIRRICRQLGSHHRISRTLIRLPIVGKLLSSEIRIVQ